MTGIDIHSASPLSADSLEQSSSSAVVKNADESISRSTSVSPGNMDVVPTQTSAPERPFAPTSGRSVPRLNTRGSISDAPLPWAVDETSSPFTPTQRKASFVPPPPRSGYRSSIDSSNSICKHDLTQSTASPAYNAYSSPYSTTESSPGSHVVDLSHPPGYTQTQALTIDSAQAPSYNNSTPFYQNSYSSYASSMSTPVTPTRRGRGILDNDPSLYLHGEADTEDETYWDTATRWAKAAGKRMSQGEQQLWRMVSAVANGEDMYDR